MIKYINIAVTSSRFDLFSLTGTDEQIRNEALDTYKRMLGLAGQWGRDDIPERQGAIVIIDANKKRLSEGKEQFHCQPGGSYEERFNLLFDALVELAPIAQRESVVLALENPGGGLLLSPLEVRELIDQINSPYLGICFNSVNAGRLGDPRDWLRILDRRVVALRSPLKDVAADETIKNQEGIMAELEEQGFKGSIVYTF